MQRVLIITVIALLLLPSMHSARADTAELPRYLEMQIPESVTALFGAAIDDIKGSLQMVSNRLRIVVTVDSNVSAGRYPNDTNPLSQSYSISVDNDAVFIDAKSAVAALFALSRLEQLVGSGELVNGAMTEQPAVPARAVHFVMRAMTVADFERVVRMARRARMNILVPQLADAVRFDSFPGNVRDDAISKAELRALVATAEANGLVVIPELKLLSHQEKFLQNRHPELLYNKVTYDPRNDELYTLIEAYLDEVFEVMQPPIVHIGHDEVRGFGKAQRRKWLAPGQQPLPAALFLTDTLRSYELIRARGAGVMMWADMLLERKQVHPIYQRNFDARQDYPHLLDKLPDDLILVDWRYAYQGENYPSTERFLAGSRPVFGATYDDERGISAYARYMAAQKDNSGGMMATTWRAVRSDDWPKARHIIERSGSAFWNGH